MSFGSFQLFNFYQQPNTGATGELYQYPNLNTTEELDYATIGENGRSGTVADYNWYYPYAKTNILISLIRNPNDYTFIDVLTECYSFAGGSGLFPLYLGNAFSGKFEPAGERAFLSSQFYGGFSPQFTDTPDVFSIFNGYLTGYNTNFESIQVGFSGNHNDYCKEFSLISNNFHGRFQSGIEFGFIKTILYGIINSGIKDDSEFLNTFSGSFYPLAQDSFSNVSYAIQGYEVKVNDLRFLYNTGSDAITSINYMLSSIQVNNWENPY